MSLSCRLLDGDHLHAELGSALGHLALRVRLWIDFLKHSYGDATYWKRTTPP